MKSALGAKGAIDYFQQATNERLCLWKWATRLGKAEGSISDIAEATVEACEDAVSMKAQAWAQYQQATNKLPALPEPDYVNGFKTARSKAMFYVAATKAGHCSADEEK